MKKILVILFAMFISTVAFAQQHMAFQGVPMGTPIKQFVKQLKGQGLEVVSKQDIKPLAKTYTLSGTVRLTSGIHEGCTINVIEHYAYNGVSDVCVFIPIQSYDEAEAIVYKYADWFDIEPIMEEKQNGYTVKWGLKEGNINISVDLTDLTKVVVCFYDYVNRK